MCAMTAFPGELGPWLNPALRMGAKRAWKKRSSLGS